MRCFGIVISKREKKLGHSIKPRNSLFTLFCCYLFTMVSFSGEAWAIGDETPSNERRYLESFLHKSTNEFMADEDDAYKKYAIDLFDKLSREKKIMKFGQLSSNQVQSFPTALGEFDPGTGKVSYGLCFDKLNISADGTARLEAFLVFNPPGGGQDSKPLILRASEVTFTAMGGLQSATLGLVGNIELVSNSKYKVRLKGSNTFATFNCDGLQQMNVGGEAVFSRSIMTPVPMSGDSVRGAFQVSMTSWSDFMAELTISSPFEVNGAPGYKFTVQDATIDLSDIRNANSFPADYIAQTTEYIPAPDTWTGFYMNKLSVQFPEKFKGQNKSPSFELSNIVVDKHGVSVNLFVNNLIPIETGNAGGWAFSIERLGIKVLHSALVEGSLEGQLQLPVMDEKLRYTGLISIDEIYTLTVTNEQAVQFDLWKTASVNLEKGSIIKLEYAKDEFTASALLTGSMTVTPKLSDDNNGAVNLPGINFQNLLIQTKKPFISAEAFGLSENRPLTLKIGGFSASLDSLRLVSDTTGGKERVGLAFGVRVGFSNIGGMGIDAKGYMRLLGKLEQDSRARQKWVYDDIVLDGLHIHYENPTFVIDGGLRLFKNVKVYGTGFRGDLGLILRKGFELEVKAMALFGTTRDAAGTDFSYWQVDALAEFGKSVPDNGTIKILGFGGGAFERMRQTPEIDPLGMSLSGITYMPDENMGLGIRASVSATYVSKEIVKARVGLELAFQNKGGLSYISLDGEAALMPGDDIDLSEQAVKANASNALKSMDDRKSKQERIGASEGLEGINGEELLPDKGAPITMTGVIVAKIQMIYNFEKDIFDASLRVKVDVKGVLVGDAFSQMHFEKANPKEGSPKGKWFIRIGQPAIPAELTLNLIGLKVNTYFMIGDDIPDAPGPNPMVVSLLGLDEAEKNIMRDENALGSGGGFAFGLGIEAKSNVTFLIFTSKFDFGIGFDQMIRRSNIRCIDESGPIGINGWYAYGQIYAYLAGSIGIEFKLFGKKRSANILNIGLAALLQAKFPRPFYARGFVGGRFEALGGLIKGNCRFKFEVGNDCVKVSDDPGNQALDDFEVIATITPAKDSEKVPLLSPISAEMNFPLDRMIAVDNDEGGQITMVFKKLSAKATIVSSGVELPGEWVVRDQNRTLALESDYPLPAGEKIRVEIVIGVFDKEQKPMLFDGEQGKEIKTIEFSTDSLNLERIPYYNVSYSYPIIEQFNYYPKESTSGIIQLKRGQNDILSDKKIEAHIVAGSVLLNLANCTYSPTTKQITFDLPVDLPSDKICSLFILSQVGDTLLSYSFRSSLYSSLKEKLNDVFPDGNFSTTNISITSLKPKEGFDDYEIYGIAEVPRLVELEADLTSNNWYQNSIYKIYNGKFSSEIKRPRANSGFQVPAVDAVFFEQSPRNFHWPSSSTKNLESVNLLYLLPDYVLRDIQDASEGELWKECTFCWPEPPPKATYRINYKYVLPDGKAGASSGQINMVYQ